MASRVRAVDDLPPHAATRAGVIDLPAKRALQLRTPRNLPPNTPMAPALANGVEPTTEAEPKRHEVLGLIALSTGVVIALALASYDARGGRDWCGPIGASIAETLIVLMGTAAVLVPWSLAVMSVRLFRRTVKPFRLAHGIGTLAIMGTISIGLHLAFGERPMLGHLEPGGLVGSTLGELLRALIGTAGAHVVTMTALLIALVLRTRLSVVSMASTAKVAGVKSGVVAKEGLATVARAWKQARDEDLRARPGAEAAAAPRVADAEERTETALADLFDHEAPEEMPRAGTRAGIMALLAAADQTHDIEPVKPKEPRKKKAAAAEVEGDAKADDVAKEGEGKKPRRGRAKKVVASENEEAAEAAEAGGEGAVVESGEVKAEGEGAAVEPGEGKAEAEAEAEAEGVEKLNIVSHDEEIKAAMRVANGVGVTVEKQPPLPFPPTAAEELMEIPSTSLLAPMASNTMQLDEAQLRVTADRLLKTLKDYAIEGVVKEIHPGPVVTTYEFSPAPGTTLSKIVRRSDEIAMSLEALSVRIVAPIPGKGRVGFEIPNAKRQMVSFREMMETPAFQSLGGALPVALGKDVVGAPYFVDLATMPHLIVAGSTGSGKSVGLNVMLTSLLYKRRPDEVRLLMIDPKQVELAVYDGIPHMLLPVVTDMKKASLALRWVVDEMERRYTLFAQTGSRNITTYNERVLKAVAEGKSFREFTLGKQQNAYEKAVGVGPDGEPMAEEQPKPPTKMPYILVVVDEFADLMMVAGKEVEAAVARLAQKARAAGIHVILATQRPSVDVITGVIKANFPSRVAFKVSQRVDSRTILDQQGAEHLLGRGDMLILPPGSSDLRRVHCAYVSEDEVQAVTDHWRKQGTPTYDEEILKPRDEESDDGPEETEIKVPMDKYEKAVALVLSSRRCSVSWVQRQLAVGYNVAARMVEKMERDGIVGPPKGPGKDREVLG
jgi:S-DNA-T family DNA segregation ATPase FtsK/SpoIIIE